MSPIWIYTIAGLSCLLIGALAPRLGGLLRLMDHPDGVHKVHQRPTPLVGGIALIVPFVWVVVASSELQGGELRVLLAGLAVGYFLLGLADDRYGLRPAIRLLFSVLLTLLAINLSPAFRVTGLEFAFATGIHPIESWHLLFNCLVIVGFVYALNMADGLDGLVPGLGLIWAGLLFFFAPEALKPLVIGLLVILVVVFSFNVRGKMFLGDSGTYALASVIALLSIASYNGKVGTGILPADVVAIWLLVPVIDCLRLITARLLLGLSPFAGDRRHLQHLLEWRCGKAGALIVYLFLVGVPAALASVWPSSTVAWSIFMPSAYAILVVFGSRGAGRALRTRASRWF